MPMWKVGESKPVPSLVRLILALLLVYLLLPAVPAQAVSYTYTVDSNGDAPDFNPMDRICSTTGAPTGPCTLRAALEEADADGTFSTVDFAAPMVITLNPALGSLRLDNVNTTIDASNHWDTLFGRPGVKIGGSNNMTVLVISGDWNYIYGLEFSGATGTGVDIAGGSHNTIGGTGQGQRNVFIGRSGVYAHQSGSKSATYNNIVGNYFGTADGTNPVMLGLTEGVHLDSGTNHTTIENNLIVSCVFDQWSSAIRLTATADNTIGNNTIGLDAAKSTGIANNYGIRMLMSERNTIGPNNIINTSASDGIYMDINANNNTIRDNWFGYLFAQGNSGDGIHIVQGAGNQILNNQVYANTGNGIYVESGAGTIIQGNGITINGGDGILLKDAANSQIGGTGSNQGNLVAGNGGDGIQVASNVTIQGNAIGGVFPTGASCGGYVNQGYGILVEGSGNTIGGTAAGATNYIGCGAKSGIYLTGVNATGNTVVGNVVGAAPTWAAANNGHHGIAVYNGASGNYIGVVAGQGNTVLASNWAGIAIVGSNNNFVLNNKVGTNGAGANLGNAYAGIHVVNSSGTTIRGNEVAYSGTYDATRPGVRIEGATSTGNTISANRIHDNAGAGIDLLNGGNGNLAAPAITSASCSSVIGTTCAGCTVEIFSDSADEGRVYHNAVTANATGAFTWSGWLNGPNVTATATDAAGNTSAFSAPTAVGICSRLCLPIVLRHH